MSLDAIGIVALEPQKSIQFYKVLGIDIVPVGGDEHFEGETLSGVRIMLDSVNLIKKIDPTWEKPVGRPMILCFKQDHSKMVDSIYSNIIEAGFQGLKEPWDAFWGQRYASVLDPDGNQIDLFANL